MTCLNQASHAGGALLEVWCNPDDTSEFLAGGISTVNGRRVHVQVVDRLAEADQLRITFLKGRRSGESTSEGGSQ